MYPCAPRFSGNRNEWVILSGQQTTDRVPVRKFDEHLDLELLADIRPTISVFFTFGDGFLKSNPKNFAASRRKKITGALKRPIAGTDFTLPKKLVIKYIRTETGGVRFPDLVKNPILRKSNGTENVECF